MGRHHPQTIRELVDQQASEQGDRRAFIFPETQAALTYAELKQALTDLALYLQRSGCRKGDKVACLLGNGRASIELYLGAQYGGFTCVPLNAMERAKQLDRILSHCEAKIVFIDRETHNRVGAVLEAGLPHVRFIPTDQDAGPPRAPAAGEVLFNLDPADENVLDYTSGTSGKPKGVLMRHHKVLVSARVHARAHEMTSDDVGLLLLPLHHMNAQHVSVLSTLYSGACLLVPHRFTPVEFWNLAKAYGVTWFAAVPTILTELNQVDVEPGAIRIRFGRCSSAPLPPEVHKSFEQKFNIPIIEAMGMTESGGTFFFNPLPPATRKYGSVGIPVEYDAKVIDAVGDEVPPGNEGSIVIRGEALMEGYYKDPRRDMFVGDWMQTGDIGYRDEDGYFFISGRDKEMIIKGGVNISPREIDETLAAHPAVEEAAAVGVRDPMYGEDIVAFVVPRRPGAASEQVLMQWCTDHMGAFKKPARIIETDALPRGPTGKLQRNRLTQQYADDLRLTAGIDPAGELPRSVVNPRLMRGLTAIWEQCLKASPVGPDDNFFDLGGYSLVAVEILDAVEEQYDRKLPVSIFLTHGTINRLARAVEGSGWADIWTAIVPIKPEGSKPPFFGIFAEDHVLFYSKLAQALDTEQPFYGVQSLTLSDEAELPKTIEQMAARYVKEIKQIQPHGPYYLGGQCIGAKIGLEVAQQLKAAGEAIGLLAVFDSSGPYAAAAQLGYHRKSLPHYLRRAAQYHRRGELLPLLKSALKNRSRRATLRKEFNKERKKLNNDPAQDDSLEARLRVVNRGWEYLYLAKPYAGKLIHFRSETFAAKKKKQPGADRWRRIAEVEEEIVPGGHISMFHEPHVQHLAHGLQRHIDKNLT